VFPARDARRTPVRFRIKRARPILLFVLATLGVVLGPSTVRAAQLNLTWVDNSGGQAGFVIQRATGTTGTYTQIAQIPLGVVSYADTTVSLGTTYCYLVAAVNGNGMSGFSNLACASPAGGFTLAAAKAGTGQGTVVSSPAGINCGASCSSTFGAGTVVTLTGTPSPGSTFSGWSSGGCSGTSPCGLAGNGSITVTATFDALSASAYTLSVSENGPGTVSSSSGGINCGSVCTASYVSSTVVTLTAVPAPGAKFDGWSGGGCSGAGTCTVTLNTAMSITASFSRGKK
jgi:hypothetical protein